MNKILLLAGDGIGPEVVREARRVLEWFRDVRKLPIELTEDFIGGAVYDKCGVPLTQSTLFAARSADAILLGAVGGPKWLLAPFDKRPEQALLQLRKELGLFANLRPAYVFDALIAASSLKPEIVRGLNLMIVRELTSGIYYGEPRGIFELDHGERRAVNTQVYTTAEIRRIGCVAFELARMRRNKVCSCEKSNVLETGLLWREEITKLHSEEFKDVELSHIHADACAMQLVRAPKQFDVIVTDNLFGDLLSDETAMLTGSIGMLPSASLGAVSPGGRRNGLYEPVHGSAPDIAGKGIANPLAAILSVAMMFRYSFNYLTEAELIEQAVHRVLRAGFRTSDLARDGERSIGTAAMGAAVNGELSNAA